MDSQACSKRWDPTEASVGALPLLNMADLANHKVPMSPTPIRAANADEIHSTFYTVAMAFPKELSKFITPFSTTSLLSPTSTLSLRLASLFRWLSASYLKLVYFHCLFTRLLPGCYGLKFPARALILHRRRYASKFGIPYESHCPPLFLRQRTHLELAQRGIRPPPSPSDRDQAAVLLF